MPNPRKARIVYESEGAATYVVGFHSRDERLGSDNYDFSLRCVLPKDTSEVRVREGKIESVMLMINGLAESDVRPYDELALDLASHGVASILLPLPNHFCRFCEGDAKGDGYDKTARGDPYRIATGTGEAVEAASNISRAILGRLEYNSILWIDGYKQMIDDLYQVIEAIKQARPGQGDFFGDHFSSKTRVNLYGYSIGGLVALCGVLSRPRQINSCFVVNSGSSLEEIDARRLFGGSWDRIQLDILTEYESLCQRGETVPASGEFELIMLGNYPKRRQMRLRAMCRRVLFILGATDDIFNVGDVMRLGSKETGILMLQLPQVGHLISQVKRDKPEWDKWRRFLAFLIDSFERNHPPDDLLEGMLETTLKTLAKYSPEEKIRAKLMLWDKGKDRLVPVRTSANCGEGWDATMNLPKGKGLCGRLYADNEQLEDWIQDCVDLSALGAGDLNYDAEELRKLKAEQIRTVRACTVLLPGSKTKKPSCVGGVAFASDRPLDTSHLTDDHGAKVVGACAVTLGEAIDKCGGLDRILGSVGEGF